MRALTRVLLPEAPAGQSFKVHCSVWLRRCPCHCSSWKVVMADKAEAIQFGDSLPLAEPANLAARLDRKSVEQGKRVAVRVDLGERRINKKKTKRHKTK